MFGQLGDGTKNDRYYAMPVLENVVDIDASGSSVMAMKADGTLWAWGQGGKRLGVGYDNTDVKTPEQVILPEGSSVKDFSLGKDCSTFLMEDGTVWMWGGRQRFGSTVSSREPYYLYELDDANVTSLSSSDNRYACIAICGSGTSEDPGEMYFWGEDVYDWCLDGNDDFIMDVPQKIVFPESEYLTDVRLGEGTIFARVGGPESGIYAWGRNDSCQTGVGESAGGDPVTVPNKIADYHSSAPLYVTPGWGSSPVALHEDGTLWTWGQDNLLTPPYSVTTEPVQIEAAHVVEAAQGSLHLVALRKDGLVYVRGSNSSGQRGIPDHLGESREYEFDFDRPVQKQDGTPLSLRNFDGPVHFLTVNVNAKQGVVTGSAPDAYQAGDMITLTAQPKAGWVFSGWSAEGVTLTDVTSPTISFAMAAEDVTVTALFEKDLAGMTGSGSFQGEVGEPDPDAIPISTAEQLASIGSGYPLDGSYVLTADLDLASYENWTPIGSNEAPFTGTFDGQGHVITGLTIDGRLERAGLFGKVDQKGVIKNLGLEQVSINVSGSVNGDCYVGGIVGQMGVDQDGYQISSVKEWQVFLYRVRYQNHIKYTDAHYELTQDIDFSQASPYLYVKNFVGVLDGNDHAIQNMTVQSAATYGEVAVFESLKEGGVIKNLRLENLMVEGSTDVGGLVGLLQDSTLSDCTVSGTVKGTKTAGALACRAENSRISDCRNYAAVSGGSGGGVGGIAGTATNCILERVYNNADISGTGGIVGSMSNGGRIVQAVNCGEVKPVNAYKTGGIVGVLSGSDTSANKEAVLDCCTNLGTVRGSSGSSMAAGGLIGGIDWPGGSSVKITNSINCGDVRINTVAKIGGIVGEVYSTTLVVTNCANTGELTFGTAIGKEKYAGGVVGYVMYSDAVLTVDNFYVSGFPTAGGNDPNSFSYEKFGRLYGGMQYNIPKNCTNCYSNADPKEYIDKNNQSDLYTYVPDMKHADFVSTLNANIVGREGLLTWQLDEEVNGGYPSFVGQGSRILYAGSNGVELYWSGAAPETETDFVLAAYDSEGRLLTVSTTSLTGSLPAQLLFEEPVELTSGCTVKVFCLSKEGLVPQRAALIYEI